MEAKGKSESVRCFDSFLTTLEHWLDDIANYFIDRHTSGFVEGFNNKLKVIKRRCYGILNVTHLGFDHGVGHPLLLLYDAKVPNCQKHKEFKDLGHYS